MTPPLSAQQPWAKLQRACRQGRPRGCREWCACEVTGRLSLMAHSADVAAVMQALLERPVIAARLAALLGRTELTSGDRVRLVALTALHDLGKINLGFQFGPFDHRISRAGHITPMLGLLDPVGSDATHVFDALLGDGRLGAAQHLLEFTVRLSRRTDVTLLPFEAVLAHHGSLPQAAPAEAAMWRARDGYDPVRACRDLVEAILVWCPQAAEAVPIAWSPAFGHAFAGLVTLADWLGSDEEWFPLTGKPEGVDRFKWAAPRAREMLRARGLAPDLERARSATIVWRPQILIGHARSSPAQAAMLALPQPPPAGRLCVIEDETGSGKTEAALIHFLDLFRQGEVDGMYFALPTRAAARQIHGRIQAALRRLLGSDDVAVTLAVPGYLDRLAATLPSPEALHPDATDERRRDALWSSERPKRYLAGFVAVGTIDQVLLGGLLVRHAQLRSAAMLRLLLVVDEVHSSDIYMTAILRNLLDQHRRAGGHALLLSATLGASTRARFVTLTGAPHIPSFAESVATPYPVVWANGEKTSGPATRPAGRVPKTVRIELDPAWDQTTALVARAVVAAREDAQVLVIRNTVRLVIETQRELEAVAPELALRIETSDGLAPCPHHARYAPEDRSRLDAALEAALGRNAPRAQGSVTIASQTAEQSLDIDADLLITDLCPADVLLQRIGRLHRHRRARPSGFEQPTAIVLAPDEATLAAHVDASGEARNGPLALGLVYPDLLGVVATRRGLSDRPVLRIPDGNRALVEAATHDQHLRALAETLGGVWPAHWACLHGSNSAFVRQADLVSVDWSKPIMPLPDLGERITARLGLNDRTVELPPRTLGPFGAAISTLSLRGHWLAGVPFDAEPAYATAPDGALAVTLGGQGFVYDRLGLRKAGSP